MSFFERFKLLAGQAGTTVNAVAEKLSLSSGSVTAWKNGTEPKTSAVIKIADHFGVTTDYLLKGTTNKIQEQQENKDGDDYMRMKRLPFFYDNEKALKILKDCLWPLFANDVTVDEDLNVHRQIDYSRPNWAALSAFLDDAESITQVEFENLTTLLLNKGEGCPSDYYPDPGMLMVILLVREKLLAKSLYEEHLGYCGELLSKYEKWEKAQESTLAFKKDIAES